MIFLEATSVVGNLSRRKVAVNQIQHGNRYYRTFFILISCRSQGQVGYRRPMFLEIPYC
jgi:hypothetical protein